MNRGFWSKLSKPIYVLAPMANVTDAAFRSIIATYGKPDVMWSEFVSADGLVSDGKSKLLIDLEYSEAERPIVAQIFGSNPQNIEKASRMVADMGFDGVDINMGCPDKAVLRQKAGGGCIRDPKLAIELVAAAKRGAGNLPVSVKTRLGYSKPDMEWISTIANSGIAALTVHLRTVKEMSKVAAHWELMPQIVEIVKNIPEENRPLLFGNGDIQDLAQAQTKVDETGCDGIMIGRGIFGNPWCFNRNVQTHPELVSGSFVNDAEINSAWTPSIPQRLQAMLEHTKLFEQKYCSISAKGGPAFGGKNFEVMKKHFKAYVNGFDGAKELRMKLMETENYAEVEKIVLEHYPILQPVLS